MALEIIKVTESEFLLMEEDWQKLLGQSSADPLFLSWSWQFFWWQTWGNKLKLKLFLLAVYDKGILVGIAPLFISQVLKGFKRLHFIGNAWRLSDTVRTEYLGFITCIGREQEVEQVLLGYLYRNADWDEWVIDDIDASSSLYSNLKHYAKKWKLHIRLIGQDKGVILDCRQHFSDYIVKLGKNTRLKTFNERKKLEKKGDLRIDVIETKAQLNIAFEQLNRLHQIRWGGPCFIGDSLVFHKLISLKMLESGCLQFSFLLLNENVISVLYNLVINGKVYNIQSSFDDKSFHGLSLGRLHLGYAIERSFKSTDCNTFDFLAGKGMKSDYKQRYKGNITHFETIQIIRNPLSRLLYTCYDLSPKWIRHRLSMSLPKKKFDHILILDGHDFASLSIVRSLGRRGLIITVASSDEKAICKYSKYTSNFFIYPDPIADVGSFYKAIIAQLSKTKYDLLIPVTESTSLPLSKIREQIETHTILAVAENNSLELITDKAKTFDLAKKVGVPVPKSYSITDEQSLNKYIEELNFPIVLKPARSIAESESDTRFKLQVDYAFDKNELQKKTHILLKKTTVILQEYIDGKGVGIELIADKGTIIHAFQHQRLHELPLTGGGSCLRKSVPVNPELLEYSRKLIKALNWHGVAMVEFKQNEINNKAYLMEINGRFWGSLPLAVFSGSDFPWYLYQLLMNEQHPEQLYSSPEHLSRKIKEDLYWYMQVIFKIDSRPIINWPTKNQMLKDFLSIFYYKHHFDAFYYKDLKPGFIEVKRTVMWCYNYTSKFLKVLYLKKKHLKIKHGNALTTTLKKSKKLLFLCYGNINRSAAAENIFLQQSKEPKYQVESAGFHPDDKRPADSNMIKVASEQGIDMSNCSSRTVNQRMVDSSDMIFVMEIGHIIELVALYPRTKNKIFLLSSLNHEIDSPLEIMDPYGKSLHEYRACFNLIKQCINTL